MKLLTLLFLPIFTLIAIFLNWERGPFAFNGPLPWIKALLWFAFAGFSAYSGYCTVREDLFQTLRVITRRHFGRQICLDLYLGAGLSFLIIYLNEPTLLGSLVWAIPSLFYLNTITLLYFAIHFESIVSRFLVMAS